MVKIVYEDLSYKIIGMAMKIHNELGPGFLEKVYENAFMYIFKKEGINATNQVPINVYFEDFLVGEYFADILVENKIILELKAVNKIIDVHKAQMINYLTATKKKLGIIINFGSTSLEFERIINKNLICKDQQQTELKMKFDSMQKN